MSASSAIGVLVPTDGTAPTVPPNERPIGRAAAQLVAQGLDVIFGDTLHKGCISGFRIRGNQWEKADRIPVMGVHDRYPSQIRAAQYENIRAELCGVPMGNSLEFTMLCRDKLAAQNAFHSAGVRMPPVAHDPNHFEARLKEWGSAFIKPQFGALGIGVQRVQPGDVLPTHTTGVVENRPDPTILQAAIQPPSGWASKTVRVLIQRTPQGGWFSGIPVVRQSRTDPVANAARGAEVAPGPEVLSEKNLERIQQEVLSICGVLEQMKAANHMVEAGIDLVMDHNHEPWLIEINSRPRGRMEVLASTNPATYLEAHINACARPLEVIAQWMKAES